MLALPNRDPGLIEQHGLTRADVDRELWVVDSAGRKYVAAAAVNRILEEFGGRWLFISRLYGCPAARWVEDRAYLWIARNRSRLSRWWGDQTLDPDVNAVLQALLSSAQTVLGDFFVGLYVHGSLATGDFEPQRSDIDFVVVTTDELPDEILSALKAMHAGIYASNLTWATKLEGAYIPRPALRRYDPTRARHPWLGLDGHFAVEQVGSNWVIQRHLIREQGIVLAGPPPRKLIDPVQPNDLRRAVLALLREWWSPPFLAPARFNSGEYQAFAILTMCRALYTLQYGTVVSKPVAARWAQTALGEPWAALIEEALRWRHGAPMDKLNETMDFIRYTLERSRR